MCLQKEVYSHFIEHFAGVDIPDTDRSVGSSNPYALAVIVLAPGTAQKGILESRWCTHEDAVHSRWTW